jgi:hypothetical protein
MDTIKLFALSRTITAPVKRLKEGCLPEAAPPLGQNPRITGALFPEIVNDLPSTPITLHCYFDSD